MIYYKIPIQAEKLINGEKADKVNLEDSIRQMIGLICTTAYYEYDFDSKFGSVIWEMDFDNIFNVHVVKNEMRSTLEEAIEKYEKRAKLESLQINIEQYDFLYKGLKTKLKLTVVFYLRINTTDEVLEHIEEFFIGPLSYTSKK